MGAAPPRLSIGGGELDCKGDLGEEFRGPAMELKSGGLVILELELEEAPCLVVYSPVGVTSGLTGVSPREPKRIHQSEGVPPPLLLLSPSSGTVAGQGEHDCCSGPATRPGLQDW